MKFIGVWCNLNMHLFSYFSHVLAWYQWSSQGSSLKVDCRILRITAQWCLLFFFPLSPSEAANVWKAMGWLPWPFTQPWLWHYLILMLSPSFLPMLVVVWSGSGILLWATLSRNQQGVFLWFRFLLVSSWTGLLQDPTKHRC